MASHTPVGRRSGRARGFFGALGPRMMAEVLERRELLYAITVNTTGDSDGANGGETISLRQAIEISNYSLPVSSLSPAQAALVTGSIAVPNTIDFNIRDSGSLVIQPETPLPTIYQPVVFDGYSQPGASPNTGGPGQGDNAVLKVQLDGSLLTRGVPYTGLLPPPLPSGLVIDAPKCTIEGLSITNFGGIYYDLATYHEVVESFVNGGGILIEGQYGTTIQGDFIGTDTSGTTVEGNAGAGIYDQGYSTTIGGSAPADRNVIANNQIGIYSATTASIANPGYGPAITNNFIGTDASGMRTLGNGNGIETSATSVYIASIADNLISGNSGDGIEGGGLITGNLIGTDVTGTLAIGNGTGILVDAVASLLPDATIGGTTAAARNVISGNTGNGIIVQNATSSYNYFNIPPGPTGIAQSVLIEGNYVGTDITGEVALGNTGSGIAVDQFGTATIGGTTAAAGNVISATAETPADPDFGTPATPGVGIVVAEGSSGALIQGNDIGLDASGENPLPNTGVGVELSGRDNTLGGTTAAAGNVISANGSDGVLITSQPYYPNPEDPVDTSIVLVDATANLVQGNFIGTDRAGIKPLGNAADGILASGNFNTIGGMAPGAANIIAANGGAGVGVDVTLADAATAGDFGHAYPLGSPIPDTGLNDAVTANKIFANAGLGIDLGDDGVTPNTPGGSATFPNHLQPSPVFTASTSTGSGVVVSGTLDSLPSAAFTIEFYSNPVADKSGYGQGEVYLGSTVVTTDANGLATFASPLVPLGQYLSATATDSTSDTSEFSKDYLVTSTPVIPIIPVNFATPTRLLGPNLVAMQGQPTTLTALVGPTIGQAATGLVGFLEDGVVIGFTPVDSSGLASFVTDQLAPGPHVITSVYLGDATHAPGFSSNAIAVSVQAALAFGGPSVTSDVFDGTNAVTITFNRGMLLGPAQDPTNYTISGPNHQKITVLSAVYDPSDASVTLTTRQKFNPKASYQLTINGQTGKRLVDVFGIPLNGKAKGKPGHDYVGKIAVRKVTAVAKAVPSGPKKVAVSSKKSR